MSVTLKLYKADFTDDIIYKSNPSEFMGYKLIIHSPNIINLNKFQGRFSLNLFWYIATLGQFKIIYLYDEDKFVHFSYITTKVFRFPFMNASDIQIGPCETSPEFQGKGIFTEVLRLIKDLYRDQSITIWTYTSMKNLASQKAFQRAGYKFHSLASISQKTKIIKIIK